VKAGSAIPLAILADAPTVRKGDPVTVEVESGRARLLFEAVAEASACDGEIVALRNPSSGKTFKARLEAGSTALLVIAGRFGQ
jgi:flagella basal body P-ring formation protein FlgA